MTDRTVRICSMRAVENGARLVINLEISTASGVEKQVLCPLTSRLDAVPRVGIITEEELSFYREESLFADALAMGYRYLGAADRSPAALLQKLVAAGVTRERAKQVLIQLMHDGVLDEEKNALREAERCEAKLWGDRRILAALRAKGYSASALTAALAYLRERDPVSRCARLIKKRRMALPQEEDAAARFAAALVRYGYTGSEMKAAVRLLTKE